ncbi:hypothetical protein Z517_00098 [Fonsecaea pedrosoi CBS 271.37]|uniref:Uncharacterized protein n=1 Tax=Fonsecaea pedrosoi CBS 271.37 TaxID=1442368 RepID=A0A0D2H1E3_9EURO|nr:uncharacterized protein Z517_00098 [Fonsecaea pedrosoi CBS 271.37]KIW84710.1 hypothetical protein Z517_00098 [Fonsecaea pedrosoi CBS 271.37]
MATFKTIGWLFTATWMYAVSFIWHVSNTVFKRTLNSIPGYTEQHGAEHPPPTLERECSPSTSSSLNIHLSEERLPDTPPPAPPSQPIGPDEQDFQEIGSWEHFCNGS